MRGKATNASHVMPAGLLHQQTVCGQGLLLSYPDVHPSGVGGAFPSVRTKCLAANHVTKIVLKLYPRFLIV